MADCMGYLSLRFTYDGIGVNMTFGKIEKNLRLNNGLTMEEVAKSIGINRSDISRYERELTKPNSEVVVKLAKYYGVTTDYLLGVSDETM